MPDNLEFDDEGSRLVEEFNASPGASERRRWIQGIRHEDGRVEVKAYIQNLREAESWDFVVSIPEALSSLFDWLDRMEGIAFDRIGKHIGNEDHARTHIWSTFVPIGLYEERLIPTDFLYLPLCSESAALPSRVSVTFGDGASVSYDPSRELYIAERNNLRAVGKSAAKASELLALLI